MTLRQGAYLIIAAVASGPLAACGDPGIFDRVAPERSATAEAASWPLLSDIPAAPPQGVYTDAAPDPAAGEAVQIDLAVAAEDAERRRKAVAGPVE